MVAETDDLLASMADMTPDQLAEVERRLEALRSLGGGGGGKPQVEDQWLEAEFSRTLASVLGHSPVPFRVIAQGKGGAAVSPALENLRGFILREFGTRNRLEQIKIAKLFFRLAVADCQRWNGGTGPKRWFGALIHQMKGCGELFDKHFPGYREAGLLPILVKSVRGSAR